MDGSAKSIEGKSAHALAVAKSQPSQVYSDTRDRTLDSLRKYPVGFGNQIRDMMPKLLEDAPGKPGPAPPDFNAVAFVKAADVNADDWPEANLTSVLIYLRGSTRLMMPTALREVFPKRI